MSEAVSELINEQDQTKSYERPRGPITRADGRECIGKVGAPQGLEATSEQFHFWVPEDALVEKTQIVTCESEIAKKTYTFYALVDEVRRQSRKHSMGDEHGEADGDLSYEPPFDSEGFTYATASILRTNPTVLIPPRERSEVLIAGQSEASLAYGADDVKRPLTIGLIKNGGDRIAGPGVVDLDYLLGVNGGHMNVNGVAGRGTKSSFLLFTIYQLLREARRRAREMPSEREPLMVVPIILNVKGYDLFFIDRRNKGYDPAQHRKNWKDVGVDDPQPFENVAYYAAQTPRGKVAVPTGRDDARAFSWSLSDLIERGLLSYLFADEDTSNENFSALLLDIEAWLTHEKIENDGKVTKKLSNLEGRPQTIAELLEWLSLPTSQNLLPGHHPGTWSKVRRRLLKLALEGEGVLRREDKKGKPLNVALRQTADPIVIDLNALARIPSLQRFAVATIFRQLVDERTGPNRVSGLVYLVALDELNRFAPRSSRDAITKLIENVAAEMRSQGIILLGSQQQASKVSETVIENSAIRALGCSGSLELSQPVWRFLSNSARRKATSLPTDEKMIIQDNFREPMHVRVPFPAWAMNPNEAAPNTESGSSRQNIATY